MSEGQRCGGEERQLHQLRRLQHRRIYKDLVVTLNLVFCDSVTMGNHLSTLSFLKPFYIGFVFRAECFKLEIEF